MPKGKVRPLTDEVATTICQAIAAGNTRECAARAVGASVDWLYLKMRTNPGFQAAIEKADAQAEQGMVTAIRTATAKEWTAAAWWLERRRHEDWGRKDKQQTDVNVSGNVGVQFIPALPREPRDEGAA